MVHPEFWLVHMQGWSPAHGEDVDPHFAAPDLHLGAGSSLPAAGEPLSSPSTNESVFSGSLWSLRALHEEEEEGITEMNHSHIPVELVGGMCVNLGAAVGSWDWGVMSGTSIPPCSQPHALPVGSSQ